jgi:hypothetical protein
VNTARTNAHPENLPAAQDRGAPGKGRNGPDEVAVGDRAETEDAQSGSSVAAAGGVGWDGARAYRPAVMPAPPAPDSQ